MRKVVEAAKKECVEFVRNSTHSAVQHHYNIIFFFPKSSFARLPVIHGGDGKDSAPHLCADVGRLHALAFRAEAQKKIVVVIVFYERETHFVVLVTVRSKILIGAVVKHPVHDGFVNADCDAGLQVGSS